MKSLLLGTLLVLGSGSVLADGLPVNDVDFACIERAQADKFVNDFSIDVQSFGGLELCDSKVDTKKLFNDLRLLSDGKFGGAAQNNLIRGFVPADTYYNWMKEETRGIERGQDVPYATAYNSGGYFTMQDGWAQLSTLGRVGTVVHEARHTEGYYHIRCNQGSYAGTSVAGCDRDYQYGGSHAIEMEYYARVSVAGQNFHPVYKKMARMMAMGRANFVFNATPLKQKETLVMIGASGKAYVLNGGNWIARETPEGRAGVLKRTSAGAALFAGADAFVLDLYENSGFNWSVFDDYSYFKLLKGDHGTPIGQVRDFEEFDLGRKRYVVMMNEAQKMTSYNFGRGEWNPLANSPSNAVRFSTWAPSGQQGLYVLDQSNRVYSVNAEQVSQSTLTNENWPADAKTFAKTGDGFYKLSTGGVLSLISGSGETAVATPESVSQVVAVPLYDAFEVKP